LLRDRQYITLGNLKIFDNLFTTYEIVTHFQASEWHEKVDYVEPSMYANKFFRLLKNNSAVVLFCRWDNFEVHAQAFRDVGFEVKNCIV